MNTKSKAKGYRTTSLLVTRNSLLVALDDSLPVTRHASRITAACGFTLLEVLIAFAITCIVLAALYSTFFLSTKAVGAVDESLLKLQEARFVVDVMKRELESAVYRAGKDYAVFKIDDRDFYGKQASRLTFTAFSPSLPALSKISYFVEENDKKLVLKKAMISAYSRTGEAKPVELMEDIESFTVEAKINDKWVKTWDGALSSGLPEQIRISLNVRTKDGEVPITISDIAKKRIDSTL